MPGQTENSPYHPGVYRLPTWSSAEVLTPPGVGTWTIKFNGVVDEAYYNLLVPITSQNIHSASRAWGVDTTMMTKPGVYEFIFDADVPYLQPRWMFIVEGDEEDTNWREILGVDPDRDPLEPELMWWR